MIERRKDLLTRAVVDDMVDDLRAGIHITNDKELAYFISYQLTTVGSAGLPHAEFLTLARRIALSRLTDSLEPV
jgi:hypothetical protein